MERPIMKKNLENPDRFKQKHIMSIRRIGEQKTPFQYIYEYTCPSSKRCVVW